MGVIYYLGQGVPQDYARALYWFEKSANQGCWTAYAPTALMYKEGKGTGIDFGKAYMWLNISPQSARMEQSFSPDGGKTWEVNWICELSR